MAKGKEKAEGEQSEVEETASQRSTRIANEVRKRKEEAAKKRKSEGIAKARKISEAFMKSEDAPMFLPFKDRDGSITTCLVIGEREGWQTKDNGDPIVDPVTREYIPEFQLLVWVFGGTSVPHQAIYDFDVNTPNVKKGE